MYAVEDWNVFSDEDIIPMDMFCMFMSKARFGLFWIGFLNCFPFLLLQFEGISAHRKHTWFCQTGDEWFNIQPVRPLFLPQCQGDIFAGQPRCSH